MSLEIGLQNSLAMSESEFRFDSMERGSRRLVPGQQRACTIVTRSRSGAAMPMTMDRYDRELRARREELIWQRLTGSTLTEMEAAELTNLTAIYELLLPDEPGLPDDMKLAMVAAKQLLQIP
jgi:hypothetical protein